MKKILLALMLVFSYNYYADSASLKTLKASYVYSISERLNSNNNYCINNKELYEEMSTIPYILLSKDYLESCNITFNFNSPQAITFTDGEQDKEDYMFLLLVEGDRLVIYRNVKRTKNLNISEVLSKIKTY